MINPKLVPIHTEDDIHIAIHCARLLMKDLSFSENDKQKVLVSIAELTRNVLDHANGSGTFSCEKFGDAIKINIKDHGPGIENLNDVLNGRIQQKRGLGLGLCGAQRLMDEFFITSSKGGTEISAIKRNQSHD